MGMFDMFKKQKNYEIVKPEEYLDEVYLFLDSVNLMIEKADIPSIAVRMRHEAKASNPEDFREILFADLDNLQKRLLYAISVRSNLSLSEIIEPSTALDTYFGAAISSAYDAGQCDEYNIFIKSVISQMPDVKIVAGENALRAVLLTSHGKGMYKFVTTMKEKHEGFVSVYTDVLNQMQELHARNRVMIFNNTEAIEKVNGAFSQSACAKLSNECDLEIEEVISLTLMYLLGRLRVNYIMLEMFDEVLVQN